MLSDDVLIASNVATSPDTATGRRRSEAAGAVRGGPLAQAARTNRRLAITGCLPFGRPVWRKPLVLAAEPIGESETCDLRHAAIAVIRVRNGVIVVVIVAIVPQFVNHGVREVLHGFAFAHRDGNDIGFGGI